MCKLDFHCSGSIWVGAMVGDGLKLGKGGVRVKLGLGLG